MISPRLEMGRGGLGRDLLAPRKISHEALLAQRLKPARLACFEGMGIPEPVFCRNQQRSRDLCVGERRSR
jgi:hypothetical protein